MADLLVSISVVTGTLSFVALFRPFPKLWMPTRKRALVVWLASVILLVIAAPEPETSEPADIPETNEEPASARYSEIVPVVYMGAGNECAVRLDGELEGAITTIVGGPGGRPALAVCARLRDSGEWIIVDGVLAVENIAGEARVLPIPPDNASMFADAPASLEALAVGHVRLTAAFGDMTGAGAIEIVAE